MRSSWTRWALGIALWTTLTVPAAAQDDEARSTWYAQALTRGGAGLNVAHFWSKGPKLRAETVVAAHKIVTIVSGDWYYAYDGLTLEGLKIRRAPSVVAKDQPKKRPFGNEYEILVKQGAEVVREEELVGRTAAVVRITDEVGRRELWVTQDDDRIPLRLEIFDRRSAERRVTDYLNWQSQLPIRDAFFEPDPNAKLEEMDHTEYLRRSASEGSVGPVPVLYTPLLYERKG